MEKGLTKFHGVCLLKAWDKGPKQSKSIIFHFSSENSIRPSKYLIYIGKISNDQPLKFLTLDYGSRPEMDLLIC
jgi:hypothetical protein